MLNTNFKKLMNNLVFTGGSTYIYAKNMINISGNYGSTETRIIDSVNNVNTACYPLTNTGTNKYGYFLFYGSGTKTPADTDYNLENPLTSSNSSLSCISMTKLIKGESTYYTSMIKNNGNESITISEIALGLNLNTTMELTFMMGRIVLDTPVTLGVGETKTFTYEIS